MKGSMAKLGWREVRRRRSQFVLLALLLGLGIAVTGAMADLQEANRANLDRAFEGSWFMDVHLRAMYGQVFDAPTLRSAMNATGMVEDIAAEEDRLSFSVFLKVRTPTGERTFKGQAIGCQATNGLGNITVNRPLGADGMPMSSPSFEGDRCLVETHFANYQGISVGDRLTMIKDQGQIDLEVIGNGYVPEYFAVIPEGEYAPVDRHFGVIMIPMGRAQELLNATDVVGPAFNDIVLRMKDPMDAMAFCEAAVDAFAARGIAVNAIQGTENLAYVYLHDTSERQGQSIAIIPLIIFSVTGIGMAMALHRIVASQRHQIGIMKSLGIRGATMARYFLAIGLLVSTMGAVLALFLYPILIVLVRGAVIGTIGTMELGLLPVGPTFLFAAVLGAILCSGCTVLPAQKILRARTIDVLKGSWGQRAARGLTTKGSKPSRLPTAVKLTMRNIKRRPGRSLSHVAGVALALALFLAFIILLQSTIMLLQGVSDKASWDYQVKAEGFVRSSTGCAWPTRFEGVSQVNPAIVLPIPMTLGGRDVDLVIVGAQDMPYLMEFDEGGFVPGQVVISRYVAKQLGLGVGDMLTLDLPRFDSMAVVTITQAELVISGVHNNLLGYYQFTDLGALQACTNLSGAANVFYVQTESGERVEGFEDGVIYQDGVASLDYVEEMDTMADQYLGALVPIASIMTLVSVIIAVAIVYNISIINAQERTREYATMRTLGMLHVRIWRLVLTEAGILTSMGVLAGAAGGYLLAIGMFASIEDMDLLSLNVIYSWEGLLVGVLVMTIVVSSVSSAIQRYIDRIDIATMIRERSG